MRASEIRTMSVRPLSRIFCERKSLPRAYPGIPWSRPTDDEDVTRGDVEVGIVGTGKVLRE